MQKIFGRQLALGERPAARALLGEPLAAAKALIKGWLFYRRDDLINGDAFGVSLPHCRGWWCRIDELKDHLSESSLILPRLSWLAPAQVAHTEFSSFGQADIALKQRLASHDMPVMIANLSEDNGRWTETDRGFVVPTDWEERAQKRAPAHA